MRPIVPARPGHLLAAAFLIACIGIGGCAATPEGPPTPPSRHAPPKSHLAGSSFAYEGTLTRRMVVRRPGAPESELTDAWNLTLRDFVLEDPSEAGTEIATYIVLVAEGEEPFEGIIFDRHRPDGGVEPAVGERAFHPAVGLLHLPRQAALVPGDPLPDPPSWSARGRLKLSNQGVLDVGFLWDVERPDPDATGLVHLRRRWERTKTGGSGSSRSGKFDERFQVHPTDGHLVRYERSWRITWGGPPGEADVEEEARIEIWLIESAPPAADGSGGPLPEIRRLREIFNGFGSSPERRTETTRRIEEFRSSFPESTFGGCLPPVETALKAIPATLDRIDSKEESRKDEGS